MSSRSLDDDFRKAVHDAMADGSLAHVARVQELVEQKARRWLAPFTEKIRRIKAGKQP